MSGDLIDVFQRKKGMNKADINKILEFNNQDRTLNNGFKVNSIRYENKIHWR